MCRMRQYECKGQFNLSVSFSKWSQSKQLWIWAFDMQEDGIETHTHVCSLHFQGGNVTSALNVAVGKRFTSAKKWWTPWAKCEMLRSHMKEQMTLNRQHPVYRPLWALLHPTFLPCYSCPPYSDVNWCFLSPCNSLNEHCRLTVLVLCTACGTSLHFTGWVC